MGYITPKHLLKPPPNTLQQLPTNTPKYPPTPPKYPQIPSQIPSFFMLKYWSVLLSRTTPGKQPRGAASAQAGGAYGENRQLFTHSNVLSTHVLQVRFFLSCGKTILGTLLNGLEHFPIKISFAPPVRRFQIYKGAFQTIFSFIFLAPSPARQFQVHNDTF